MTHDILYISTVNSHPLILIQDPLYLSNMSVIEFVKVILRLVVLDYRSLMQGRYSIHAPLLMKTLLQHFMNQDKAPPFLLKNSAGGSVVIGLACEYSQ